jgi:molecular chaperone IbpA
MNTINFSPLFSSTIGFDRVFDLLDSAAHGGDTNGSYPPYNIVRTGENAYQITMAVAGFGNDDLNIEARENVLTVSGNHGPTDGETNYLHRGIAARNFRRTFELADHVEVVGASLDNGLLNIDLVRELPEKSKPRQIAISTSPLEKVSNVAKKLVGDVKNAA